MKVSVGKAAKELGVHPETLRRWEKQGKIVVERTPTGLRRYDLTQVCGSRSHKNKQMLDALKAAADEVGRS